MTSFLNQILFFAIPSATEMTREEKIRRSVFSLGFFMCAGAVMWILFLLYLGLDLLSLIPGLYILLTAINLFLIFDWAPEKARFVQIFISLIFPFGMQAIMGGYYASGVVMLWSSVSFLATFTMTDRKAIVLWVLAFFLLFASSFYLDDTFQEMKHWSVTNLVSRNLLVFNILVIGTIMFYVSLKRIERDSAFIEQLRNALDDLNDYKIGLEAKIEDRTKELEATVFVLKETKNEMKKALIQAREATESRGMFMTSISHEIRTPLNAILGYAQFMELKSNDHPLPPEFKNYLLGIQSSGNHLLELVNNFLDISRVDSGKMVLSMEPVNIRKLLNKIHDIGSGKCKEKQLSCNFSISPGIPEQIKTDSTKITQIVLNLVSNAMKFTDPGKRIGLTAEREDDFLLLKVEDQGKGIKAEDIPGIFDPFIQLNRPSGLVSEGSGLGLAITKKLVELFGGTIQVESKENEGSVFIVRLPLIPVQQSESNYGIDLKNRNVRFLSGQKVLIVEDNPVNVQLLEGLLKEFGLSVVVAYNGKEGVEMAKMQKPDVIFMDIHMPVMDGLEALKNIMEIDSLRAIPVICLTADVFGTHKNDPLSLGFSDHLTKPIDFNRLIAILEKYLLTDLS